MRRSGCDCERGKRVWEGGTVVVVVVAVVVEGHKRARDTRKMRPARVSEAEAHCDGKVNGNQSWWVVRAAHQPYMIGGKG